MYKLTETAQLLHAIIEDKQVTHQRPGRFRTLLSKAKDYFYESKEHPFGSSYFFSHCC